MLLLLLLWLQDQLFLGPTTYQSAASWDCFQARRLVHAALEISLPSTVLAMSPFHTNTNSG